MAERNLAELKTLLHPNALFVHMGGNFDKATELAIIEKGDIQYKHADIQERHVRIAANTALVVSKVQMTSIVHGNEVSFLFTVTETFTQEQGQWQLLALVFTKLLDNPA
ncbi:uncharacterized protein DUF4440 [Cricetibacter osteomyelitidis]|uniref:Uncharacterized protein DUF4440 n=1 Tax=Cricetibacter osteomyelitidis TaxID=1521931 RepID=A0A4R2T579_9PAST|nr:nuclear transport factor 2 family protein [Cricetibacter osteomyelitidis]TCP95984.1 uncharacterized protein DUF4440 [Cricetibacter osteomyelitidis]